MIRFEPYRLYECELPSGVKTSLHVATDSVLCVGDQFHASQCPNTPLRVESIRAGKCVLSYPIAYGRKVFMNIKIES